jgi:hypothetical protein
LMANWITLGRGVDDKEVRPTAEVLGGVLMVCGWGVVNMVVWLLPRV